MRYYSVKELSSSPTVPAGIKKTLEKPAFKSFDGYIGDYVAVTTTSGKKVFGKLVGIGERNTYFHLYEIRNDDISLTGISIYFLAGIEPWKDADSDDKLILDSFIEAEFGAVQLPLVK